MSDHSKYAINMEEAAGFLKLIDISALVAANHEPWYCQNICRINDSSLRLGVFKGEFHFHHHDDEDELFYVVSGELLLDIGSENVHITYKLGPNEGLCVPKGTIHRTRALETTVVLMIAGADVVATGD